MKRFPTLGIVSGYGLDESPWWFEPGQSDVLFKGDNNPQHTFLSDGK
jgi:hypothetical protein